MAKRGPTPGSPQAKRGGQAVKAKYGSDFYREIGKIGGNKMAETRPRTFFSEIGRKGGQATLANNGPEFFKKIGLMGGRKKKSLA